jgi:hypothetical protein
MQNVIDRTGGRRTNHGCTSLQWLPAAVLPLLDSHIARLIEINKTIYKYKCSDSHDVEK